MQISFLNDVDIQLIIEFKTVLENTIKSFLKTLKCFLGNPIYLSIVQQMLINQWLVLWQLNLETQVSNIYFETHFIQLLDISYVNKDKGILTCTTFFVCKIYYGLISVLLHS